MMMNRALFLMLLLVIIASAQQPSAAQNEPPPGDCPHMLFYDDATGVFVQIRPWEMPYRDLTPDEWSRVKWHRYRAPWSHCAIFVATY